MSTAPTEGDDPDDFEPEERQLAGSDGGGDEAHRIANEAGPQEDGDGPTCPALVEDDLWGDDDGPRRPYDALTDRHCRQFVRGRAFQQHWATMRPLLDRHKNIERAVDAFRHRPLAELPRIAQRPQTIARQATRLRQRAGTSRALPGSTIRTSVAAMAVPRTPYLSPDVPLTSYDALFLPSPPPVTPTSRIGTPRCRHVTQRRPPTREAAATLSPPGTLPRAVASGESPLPSPAPRPPVPQELSVLTQLYAGVLEKSEGYQRRQVAAAEADRRGRLFAAHATAFGRLDAQRQQRLLLGELAGTERDRIGAEEESSWGRISAAAVVSEAAARAQEEVFPRCPLLGPGEAAVIEQAGASAIALDVRWSGSATDAVQLVLLFYSADRLVMVAAGDEVLRCSHSGLPVVRPWGDYRFRGPNQAPRCRRATLELMLLNLSPSAGISRVFVALLPSPKSGSTLSYLRRGYCTLRLPARGAAVPRLLPDTSVAEHVAMALSPAAAGSTAMILGSFVSAPPEGAVEGSGAGALRWAFVCALRPVDAVSLRSLPRRVEEHCFASADLFWSQLDAGMRRLAAAHCAFWERLFREALLVQAEHERIGCLRALREAVAAQRLSEEPLQRRASTFGDMSRARTLSRTASMRLGK